MKAKSNPFLKSALLTITGILYSGACAHAETMAFNALVGTNTTTHTISATDWAAYTGNSSLFNDGPNGGGRLYWRSDAGAGDGNYMHFDLSSLTGLIVVEPVSVTLQNSNATWGGGVDGSFIATANGAWTAAQGAAIPGATAIAEASNATGSYGTGVSVSWGIGATTFQGFVDNQANFNGLAVIGGSGSQLHFDSPMNPYLTVTTGTLVEGDKVIDLAGGSTWESANYSFNGLSKTLSITGAITSGTSGAGAVTILNGGIIAVNQTGGTDAYQSIDSTTIQTGGKLTSNGKSILQNLTLSGGELASSATDPVNGGWTLTTPTTVTGGVTSTISARDVNLANGNITVDAGSTLDLTGSIRSGSLTKNGAGGMKISSIQSYSGGTTVNAGTLELAGQNSGNSWLQGAITVNSGATLAITGGDGSGFGWNNSVTSLTINGGTVDASGGSHIGFGSSMVVSLNDGGTISGSWQWRGDDVLSFSSSGDSTNTISGYLNLRSPDGGPNHTFNVADGMATVDLLVTADLSDRWPEHPRDPASCLVKTGAGTLSLSGENTYNGSTVASQGVLLLASTNALQNSTLELNTGDTGTVTFNQNSTLGGLSGSRDLDMGGFTLSIGNNGISTMYAGALSDGALNKIGTGTLTLSGNNTYSGTTTVSAGTLSIAGANALSGNSAVEVASGAELRFDLSSDRLVTAPISGQGSLVKTGAGTLSLSGENTYTGSTWLYQGTLVAASASALHNSTLELPAWASGNAVFTQNSTLGGLSGSRDLNMGGFTLSIGNNGNSTTFEGTLSNGALNKIGAGTLTLSGNNTYSGTTTVSAGTLSIAGTNALPGDSGVEIANSAVLQFDLASDSLNSNSISGQGSLVKLGAGKLTLAGTNTYAGGTTVTAGSLVFSNTGAKPTSGTTSVAAGATLGLGVGGAGYYTSADITALFADTMAYVTMSSTANVGIDTTAGDFTHADSIASTTKGLTKLGSNKLTLSGNNTYSGTTAVSAGTLSLVGSGAIPGSGSVLIENGATLDFTVNGSDSASTQASISGQGTLVKNGAGTVILSSTGMDGTPVNTYTGGTVINGGILEIHGRSADNYGYTSLGAGPVTINDGGTLVSAKDWSTGNEWNYGCVGTITINQGGTWTIHAAGSTVRYGLILSGGSINGTGANSDWGGMYLRNTSVTAGGNTTSSISVDTAMNAATTMQVDSGSTLNFSGNLHNSYQSIGGITKTGAGTLSLSGENTYTGNTRASEGSLIVANANALQNSTLELNGGDTGTATFNQNSTLGGLSGSRDLDMGGFSLSIGKNGNSTTYGGALSNGALNKIGTGTLTLSGTNTYTGGTTVTAGSLVFSNISAKPATGTTTVADGATLVLGVGGAGYFSSSDVAALFANTMTNVTMGATANVGVDTTAGDLIFSDSIASATKGLIKLGNNTLTLNGNNSYTGGTTVNSGTLILSGNNSERTGGTFIEDGASLQLQANASNTTNGISTALANNDSAKLGMRSSTLQLRSDQDVTFAGGDALGGLGGETLTIDVNSLTGGQTGHTIDFATQGFNTYQTQIHVTGGNGYTLRLGRIVEGFNGSLVLNAETANLSIGDIGVSSQVESLSVSGSADTFITGSINAAAYVTKTGAGTLSLSGANTYTGYTNIAGGNLVFSNTAAKPASSYTFVQYGATLGLGVGGAGYYSASDVTALFTDTMANVWMSSYANVGIDTTVGDFTYADSIASTTKGLTKLGNNKLTLTGTNSYTGTTTVSAGTLSLVGAGAIPGSGSVLLENDATLDFTVNGSDSVSTQISISGQGEIVKSGAGTLSLLGETTYTGSTRASNGSLMIANVNALQNSTLELNNGDTGTITFNQHSTLGGLSGSRNLDMGGVTLSIGNNGNSTTFTGALSNGALNKIGSGMLTLTGSNSYSGATTVSAGTLSISGSGALPSDSAVAIQSGAVLELNEGAANRTWTSAISGQGTLVKAGTGTLTFSSAYTKSGVTTISDGTLVLQDTYGADSQFDIASGAVLELNVTSGSRDLANASFNGTGTLRKTGAGEALWGATTAAFNLGAGALIDVQEGILRVGSHANETWTSSEAALNVAAGATFKGVEANVRLDKITGLGTIGTGFNGAGYQSLTLGVNNGSSTFEGIIQNTGNNPAYTGNVTKTGTGTLTLSGTNTYTGTTTVSQGTLIVNGSISTSITTVQSGATIGGSGELGALTVEAGGFVTPGNSPGVLNTGDYNQAGTLMLDINGTTAGTEYDQINVTGTVTLSGNLTTLLAGYTPVDGDLLFILLNDGNDAISGTFSGLADNTTFNQNGQDWQISYNADSGSGEFDSFTGNDIALRAIPEPGTALLGGLGLLALLRRRR